MSENKIIEVPKMEYWDKDEKQPKFIADIHSNGSLQYLERRNEAGSPDGLSEAWRENGKKWYEQTWKDGKRHGLEIKRYPNNKKEEETDWVDGKLHGKKTVYNLDGSILIVEYYNKGIEVKELKDVE